ncbi:MAG: YfjI family protein [Candidatus Limnocylindria bacterium]
MSNAYADSLLPRRAGNGTPAPKVELRPLEPVPEPSEPSAAWHEPDWLDAPDLPAFPTDALPEPFASFVAAEAEATQTPADLAGMHVLSVLSAVCIGYATASPAHGWSEPLALWTVVAMEPGSRKSALHRDTTAPLLDYERELIEGAGASVADAAGRRRIAEQRLTRAEKRAADASGPEARDAELEARALAVELAEMPSPSLPRLFTADATPEAIASLMAGNGGVLSVLSAEGGVFGMMAGRYSKAPDLEIYLKGHAGDSHRIDRKGRATEYLEAAVLTLGLAVQPYVLRQAARNEEFTGRGLLDRFLYALPVPTVGYRAIRPAPVPEELRTAYREAVIDLGRAMRREPEPVALTFDAEAAGTFDAWSAELEPRRRPHADLGPIAGWSSKLDGAAVRIAALLHLAANARQNRRIPARTVLAALSIADYLIPHAQAAFGAMRADPRLEDARHVARWIRSTHREAFTRRDAHRAAEHRFATVEELLPALAELEARSYIRRQEPEPRPGRPSEAYEVNPAVLDGRNVRNLGRIVA